MFDLYVKEVYIFKDIIYNLKDILIVLVRGLKRIYITDLYTERGFVSMNYRLWSS